MQDWLLKRGNATVLGKLEGTIGGGGGGRGEGRFHNIICIMSHFWQFWANNQKCTVTSLTPFDTLPCKR